MDNLNDSGPRPSRRVLKRRCEEDQSIIAINHIKSEPDLLSSSEEPHVPPMQTVCRVCLVKHLQLYTITKDMQNVYQTITREEYNKVGYPVSICYICWAELRKCERFVKTARDSNRVLEQWSNQQHELRRNHPFRTYVITRVEAAYIGKVVVSSGQLVKTEVEDLHSEEFIDCNPDDYKYDEIDNVDGPCSPVDNNDMDPVQDDSDRLQESKSSIVEQAPGTSGTTTSNTITPDIFRNIKTAAKTIFVKNDLMSTKGTDNINKTKSNFISNTKSNFVLNPRNIFNSYTKNNSVSNTKSISVSNTKNNSISNPRSIVVSNITSCAVSNLNSNSVPNTKSNLVLSPSSILKSDTKSQPVLNTKINNVSNPKSHSVSNSKSNSLSNTKRKCVELMENCSVCNFKYATENELSRHMRFHDSSRPHACDVCQYRFDNLINLKKHTVMHQLGNGKEHICEECDFKSCNKYAFYNHLRSHVKTSYSCHFCERKFTYKAYLAKHVSETHTDKKIFSCDNCHYKSLKKVRLREHIVNKHTGVRLPFSCDICYHKFINIGSLKHHLQTKHDKSWYIISD